MTQTNPISENGIIAGDVYGKYGTNHPIVRYLMKRLLDSFDELVVSMEAVEIHEVGCGEGYTPTHCQDKNLSFLR